MRQLMSRREVYFSLPIVALGLVATLSFWLITVKQYDTALADFRLVGDRDSRAVATKVEENLRHIHQNLRTLAALPGVRKIDRHAKNIDPDTLNTFQQIYNNLASSVDISEVYIIPAGFNPDKFDPITLKNEEPILMFDELIVGGGKNRDASLGGIAPQVPVSGMVEEEEVEAHEYRQYVDILKWFAENHPTNESVTGLEVPIISGQPIITCDNRLFNSTKRDEDRMGMTFSVPFFRPDGKLGGIVTGIILMRSLEAMVPEQHYVISNLKYGFHSLLETSGQEQASTASVTKGQRDPELLFSAVMPIAFPDPRAQWQIWAGLPNSSFGNSADVTSIRRLRGVGIPTILLITLGSLMGAHLISRNRKLSREIAVERAKMLSSLTAKVSHEIRNPLGSIRTATFIVRRMSGSNLKVVEQLDRVERGIVRCDRIITDLLDYTQPQPPIKLSQDLAGWLVDFVKAFEFPESAKVRLELVDEPVLVKFDGKQLHRDFQNLVKNALEAAAAGAGADIDIVCRKVGTAAEVTITDRGHGIDALTSSKAFDPLFTTKSFGAGLGLPSARSILDLHGGKLELVSEANKGTHAIVILPLDSQERAVAEAA